MPEAVQHAGGMLTLHKCYCLQKGNRAAAGHRGPCQPHDAAPVPGPYTSSDPGQALHTIYRPTLASGQLLGFLYASGAVTELCMAVLTRFMCVSQIGTL